MEDHVHPGEVAVDALVLGTAGLIGLFSPDLMVASAASAPLASATIKAGIERLASRRRHRQEYVFDFAARVAKIGVEELQRRCENDERLEELLLLVLDAAGETAMREKLVAYGLALGEGVATSDADYWQSALVRAVRDLGPEHLALLDRFTWTTNKLGLGDGTSGDFDIVPIQLADGQVEMVARDIPALSSALAMLQRHGLLMHQFAAGGATLGGGPGPLGSWKLTEFGRQVHDLLRELGSRLEGSSTDS